MPPRKRTTARNTEEAKTHYHIVVVDGEGNRIRFGPLTSDDVEGFSPARFAKDLADDVANLGLEQTLAGLALWGGIRIRLEGDDGTKIEVCEIPWTDL